MAAERILVVGGGIAGLVAARRLALGGLDVTVIEAHDRLGGQVARHTVGGIDLDAAAESFATRRGTVAGLARTLGIEGDLVVPRAGAAWLHRADGSAVPLPATGVSGIPGVPLAGDVVAAIGLRAAVRAQLDSVMLGQIGSGAVTLGELVERRMGRGVLEGLVAPVVRGVHSASPDELDVDRAVPGLRRAFLREGTLASAVRDLRASAPAGSQVQGLRGGVFRLVERLAADLERFGVTVIAGRRVQSADTSGIVLEGGAHLAGEPLIAAPGIAGSAEPGRRITLVTLVVDAPELAAAPRGTGVLVAEGAAVRARALTHLSAKWKWVAEAAAGRAVLRLSYDGEPSPDAVPAALADATTLLGVPLGGLEDAAIVTWERAAPRVHSVDGMHYVGESVSGTGIAAVVAQAEAVATERTGNDTEPPG
jgi:oxygen-dependent protoporphyrinogen oxidase